jgi:Hsp70 protein
MAKDPQTTPLVVAFTDAEDNQPAVDPGGTQQIEVVLDIDADGVLNLFTRDRETGAQQATISENSHMAGWRRCPQAGSSSTRRR